MDREKFDKLNIIEQIEYVNQKLNAGLSLNAICKELKIDRKSIRRRAKKINYILDQDQKQYVLDKTDPTENITKEIKNITSDENQEESSVLPNITKSNIKKEDQEMKINKKVFDELMEMLDWYKTNKKDIVADPGEDLLQGETITKSFKIYTKVLEKFEAYCQQHPKLKKQDVVNAAIMEYIKNN